MKKTVFNFCMFLCVSTFPVLAQTTGGAAGTGGANTGGANAGATVNGGNGAGGVNARGGVNNQNRDQLPNQNPGSQAGAAVNVGPNGVSGSVNSGVNNPNTVNPNPAANVTGTNLFPAGTNDNGLTPASRPGATNRFFATNQFNSTNLNNTNDITGTNGSGLGPQDIASSEFDRTIIIRIRQTIIQRLGGTPTAWAPVIFNSQNGAIRLMGTVPSVVIKQRVVGIVQTFPGVVRVIDQLTVDPNMSFNQGTSIQSGATGVPGQALTPASPTGGNPHFWNGTNLTPTGRPMPVPRSGTFTTNGANSTATP